MSASSPNPSYLRGLKCLAELAISRGLTEEADSIAQFMVTQSEQRDSAGLLSIWIQSERGNIREALRQCEDLQRSAEYDDCLLPLLALLRYVNRVPTWRGVCEEVLSSPQSSSDARRTCDALMKGDLSLLSDVAAEPAADEAQGDREVAAMAAGGQWMRV